MTNGVRVVGAPGERGLTGIPEQVELDETPDAADLGSDDGGEPASAFAEGDGPRTGGQRRRGRRGGPRRLRRPRIERRRRAAVIALAALALAGLVGTLGFGFAWAGQRSQAAGEAAAKQAASSLLVDLTNFNAKTVDADFSAITSMATGTFAGQAKTFFNSTIRHQLEVALASSRGQIRNEYVQTYTGNAASVYAVIDQLYANNKVATPQSDVLRVVVDESDTPAGWKVSDVTVLEGPSSAASGSPSASTATTATSGP